MLPPVTYFTWCKKMKVFVLMMQSCLSFTEESSSVIHATLSLPSRAAAEDKDKEEMNKDGKVFLLRRSRRVPASPAPTDSDDDDVDEEDVQRFLSQHMLDEDDSDEDAEALKPVEKKCPYCPDRFHNGIGLANHVRGHLNRVGVSYNVRHFISPEEVNAIEKKFSYQKKKKKGLFIWLYYSFLKQ